MPIPFTVIIPSKTDANLDACVNAIRRAGEHCRVIVIDDGLQNRREDCEYIEGVKPFCYAKNINLGIAAAGTDDVILLNDDAVLQNKLAFTQLAQVAHERREFGIVSPGIRGVVGNPRQKYDGTAAAIREEPATLMFVCVYIRRAVLDRIGLLDEQFTGYGHEDNDFCRRVLRAGYRLAIWDGVQVEHEHLKSTFRGDGYPREAHEYNRKLYLDKWSRPLPPEEEPKPFVPEKGKYDVEVLLFSYRTVSTNALMALQGMIRHTMEAGVAVNVSMYGNALIHKSRNQALARLRPEATHALFVDDDMLPQRDALLKLLELDRPIVSALCTTRQQPIAIAARIWDPETDAYGGLDTVNLLRPVEGNFAVGAAFLLVRRDVIGRLIEHHLSAQDWVNDHAKQFVRLKVRAENRDKERERISALRRKYYEQDKSIRIFDFPISDAEQQLGEDLAFARRVREIGVPIVIDGRTKVGHIGEYPYSVWDIINREAKEK